MEHMKFHPSFYAEFMENVKHSHVTDPMPLSYNMIIVIGMVCVCVSMCVTKREREREREREGVCARGCLCVCE